MINGKKITATGSTTSGEKGGGSSCLATINGISANGNNTINVNGCNVEVGTNIDMGQSTINVDNGMKIKVRGATANCSKCATGTVVKSSDPLVFPSIPEPTSGLSSCSDITKCSSCTKNKVCTVNKNTKFTEDVNLENGTTYLFPAGTYVFKKALQATKATVIGPANASGNWVTNDSSGVMFYISGGQKLQLDGSIYLKAPSNCTGTDKSYAIYNPTPVAGITKWAGNNVDVNIIGYADLRGQDLELNGTSAKVSVSGSLVANSIKFSGSMSQTLSANGCFNFDAPGSKVLFK